MATPGIGLTRSTVCYVGDAPPAEEFERRALNLAPAPEDRSSLRGACALLVRVSTGGVPTEMVREALEQGLHVFVLADDDSRQQGAIDALAEFSEAKSLTFRTEAPWWEIAERAARWDPQRPEGDVRLDGDQAERGKSLLRRAFADCSSISLERIGGGFSGAYVFRVHAVFQDSVAGPRPLPFFAKVDDARAVSDELQKYQRYVDRFIPFYLRPHLDYSRCIICPSGGILVGDFVEHSEPLRSVLKGDRGRQALGCLFEETLRGWHAQAEQHVGNVPRAIHQFKIEKFPEDRVRSAMDQGACWSPEQLVTRLAELEPIAYRQGSIHGDLICGNVQVRGGDAILIDFLTTRLGPIVADPASLEVDVVFSHHSAKDHDGWAQMVDRFYRSGASRLPEVPVEPSPRAWIWQAVRQIRLHGHAFDGERQAYNQAVATYLLRRAVFRANGETEDAQQFDERRREYAYVLADSMIRSL